MKILKILPILIVLSISSCKKEDPPCNCGKINSMSIETTSGYQYVAFIQNSCSNSEKKFYMTYDEYLTLSTGDIYCPNGISNW